MTVGQKPQGDRDHGAKSAQSDALGEGVSDEPELETPQGGPQSRRGGQ
jgi:hypothetical protein